MQNYYKYAIAIGAIVLSALSVSSLQNIEVSAAVPIATGTITPQQFTSSGWQTDVDGNRYYCDENGNALTGAQIIDNVPYLFAKDGAQKLGWQTVNGKRYYYDYSDGSIQLGWITLKDKTYYIDLEKGKYTGWNTMEENGETSYYCFDKTGVLSTGFFRDEDNNIYYASDFGSIYQNGTYEINGDYYKFRADGTEVTGWQTINGKRNFYSPITGEIQYGWIQWNGHAYYATQEAGKYTDVQLVEDNWYPFDATYGCITEGLANLPDGKIRCYLADGTWRTGWYTENKQTYYFKEDDGAANIGWLKVGTKTYYMDENGIMQVGLLEIDGANYYFNNAGEMQTGLQRVSGKYYFFSKSNGAMAYGFQSQDGKTYYFGEDGTAVNKWLELDDTKYYFKSYVMVTGWQTISGYTYYFDSDGKMLTRWQTIDGKKYYFGSGGQMNVGFLKISGVKYHFAADGSMDTGWKTIEGRKFYFDETGAMQTGWQTLDGKKYYFDENGMMAEGFALVGANTYYFGTDGVLVTGPQKINGAFYYLDRTTGALMRNMNANGYTTDANGVITRVLLDVGYLSQTGYPTGCESASATMLLQNAGYSTTIAQFIDNYLDIGTLYTSNGVTYGPSPNSQFIGDPRSSSGYGCYAPVITNAINRVCTNGDKAVNLTGSSLDSLLTNYINEGTPVAIWATINMMTPEYGSSWVLPDGSTYTWIKHEHCLVLVGYDNSYYYFNDPYKEHGLIAFARSTVESRYASLGYQAVAIVKG